MHIASALVLLVLVLVGCKGERSATASSTPEAGVEAGVPRTAPVDAAAAADAPVELDAAISGDAAMHDAAMDDAAANDAAANDAGANAATAKPVKLVRSMDGVGPIELGLKADRATLARLLPGYVVEETEDSFEGTSYKVYAVTTPDGRRVLQITPRDDEVAIIVIFDAVVTSANGIVVGVPYSKIAGKLDDCSGVPHDDPLFPSRPTCSGPDGESVFFDRPFLGDDDRLNRKQLAKSRVVGIELRR